MATTVATALKEARQTVRPLARLVRFFAKYPPSQYSAMATGQAIPTSKQRITMDAKPLSSTSLPQASSLPDSLPDVYEDILSETDEGPTTVKFSTVPTNLPPNPFLPYKNPESGRWRGARVGLRQQADLYKCARELGLEELLPASVKSSAYKQQRALERGLAVKGTGEGQRVKGHKWERTIVATLDKRRKAMEGMPELIREWEQKGHGRGWKKYPSGKK